jgi:hypothetical protein
MLPSPAASIALERSVPGPKVAHGSHNAGPFGCLQLWRYRVRAARSAEMPFDEPLKSWLCWQR